MVQLENMEIEMSWKFFRRRVFPNCNQVKRRAKVGRSPTNIKILLIVKLLEKSLVKIQSYTKVMPIWRLTRYLNQQVLKKIQKIGFWIYLVKNSSLLILYNLSLTSTIRIIAPSNLRIIIIRINCQLNMVMAPRNFFNS